MSQDSDLYTREKVNHYISMQRELLIKFKLYRNDIEYIFCTIKAVFYTYFDRSVLKIYSCYTIKF